MADIQNIAVQRIDGQPATLGDYTGKVLLVVNVASNAALGGNRDFMQAVGYNTSKGAVVTFTRALAAEWGAYNITVNAIGPGVFPSKMSRYLTDRHGVEALAARLAAIHGPLAVMGDFNAAPWSRTLRQLSDRAGLRRRHRALGTYRGGAGGRGGAWFVPGGLPIDHILTRPGLAAESVRTIEIPGSDHLGLAATLRLTAAPPP